MPRRARIGTAAWPGHAAPPDQVLPDLSTQVDATALPEAWRELFLRRKASR